MKNKRHIFLFILLSLLCFSCKKKEFYRVDETLDPYLQMFLDEAKERGFNFNVEKNGLIMEFAKLTPPVIGLCTYSDPLLVQIDKNYWNEVTQYENCEELRQNVVFHELAHGLLNRKHDNGYLPNTEWKSIMCGGDLHYGRSWQVNFNGYRKRYYIDELFNTKIPAPEWSQPGEFSNQLGPVFSSFNFNREIDKTDKNGNTYSIKDGVYSIKINTDNNAIISLYNTNNLLINCYYEVLLRCDLRGNGDCVGIGTSHTNNYGSFSNFFYVAKNTEYNDYRAYAVNSKCMPPLAEVLLDKGDCDLTDYTKIAMMRKNDEIFYYINDKLVYRHDYDAKENITGFCIVAPVHNTVEINASSCYYLAGTEQTKSATSTIIEPTIGKVVSTFTLPMNKMER